MANVAEFSLMMHGPAATLATLKTFLLSAVSADGGGYWGEYTLDCLQLFPEVGGHTFLGLDRYETAYFHVVEDNCFLFTPDRTELSLHGAAKWMPPVVFAHRLSVAYPVVDFHLRGTTEHELFESWKITNGLIELWELITTDLRADNEIVHVKDGIHLTSLPDWFSR